MTAPRDRRLRPDGLFEHSAHSPMLEEPDRTLRIMTEDVLAGRASLADGATAAAR